MNSNQISEDITPKQHIDGSSTRKRNKQEIEEDKVLIIEMSLQNYSLQSISDHISNVRPYSLSKTMIQRVVKKVHKEWEEQSLHDINLLRMREVQKSYIIEREAFKAYELSKSSRKTTEKKQRKKGKKGVQDDGEQIKEVELSEIKVKEEERIGDPVYLKVITEQMKFRADLLGMKQTNKVQVKTKYNVTVKKS